MNWFVLVFITLLRTVAYADSQVAGVTTKFIDGDFVTQISFDVPVDKKDISVDYTKQAIQITIPDTKIKTGKIVEKINKNKIESVFVENSKGTGVVAKVIFAKGVDIEKYKGLVQVDNQSDKIVLTISRPSDSAIVGNPPSDLNAEAAEELKPESPESVVADEMMKPSVIDITNTTSTTDTTNTANSATNETPVIAAGITKDTAARSQSLPLFKEKQRKTGSEDSGYLRMIMGMIFVLVLSAGLLFFTKWWAKNKKSENTNIKIQMLTQFHIGPKKSLAIVRVAGESILLGVTDQNISMIKTLSFIDDEIVENAPKSFRAELNYADRRETKGEVSAPKMTSGVSFQEDALSDLKKQISNKLGKLKEF